jgi:hypothetical protein
MAVGFPTKANWAAGDVLTASQMDDLAGTVNLLQNTYNTVNAQTGTTYTFVAGDAFKTLVTTSNAAAITVTIPPSIFVKGQTIDIQSIGAGLTTFAAGSGVTITSTGATPAAPKLRVQYSAATVICTGTNTFTVVGDLA